MDAAEAARRWGGRATWAQLRALGVSRAELSQALAEKALVKSSHGRYRWAGADGHDSVAHALSATLSHRSAAQRHGLEVWTSPEKAEVIVRRNRRLSPDQRRLADIRYRDLDPDDDVTDGVTTQLRTVVDCARDLPFAEALAVADSALRRGTVSELDLARAARDARGQGAPGIRRVAAHASPLAANPFESALRSIAVDAGLDVQPQFHISAPGIQAWADLADEGRRLVVEAEGFEHHGTRSGLRRDVRRYSLFVLDGWAVLRFAWEEVTLQADYVRWALENWRLTKDGLVTSIPEPPPQLARLA